MSLFTRPILTTLFLLVWLASNVQAATQGPRGFQIVEYPLPTHNGLPVGITSGADGNLWFTESIGNKIGRITPAGTITEFSVPTAGANPYAIARAPDGDLWFTEYSRPRIGRITPDGAVKEYSTSSGSAGITVSPDNTVWFTEMKANKIGRLDTQGRLQEYSLPAANASPFGITTAQTGDVWFTEAFGHKIGKIAPSGAIAEYPLSLPGNPTGISEGPDGNIWFTMERGDKIGRITRAGTVTGFEVPNRLGTGQIAVGPDGNLWFTQEIGAAVGRVTVSGHVTLFPIPTLNSSPFGIVTGPDGALWFAEESGNKIAQLTVQTLLAADSVRVESPRAAPDWDLVRPSITRVPTGKPVDLVVYAHVTNAHAGSHIVASWLITRNGSSVLKRRTSMAITAPEGARLRLRLPITLGQPGSYRVAVRLGVGSVSKTAASSFEVIRGAPPVSGAVSLQFGRLSSRNRQGAVTTHFAPGDPATIQGKFAIQNLRGTARLTVIRAYEQRGSAGWEPLGHPITEVVDTANGVHPYQFSFVPNPTVSPQRIVVGLTVGATTRKQSVVITVNRSS